AGHLRSHQLGAAALGLSVAIASWLVALAWRQGGNAISFFLLTNHLGRLLGSGEVGHLRSAFYYVPNLTLDLLPWSIALPGALVAAGRRARDPALVMLIGSTGHLLTATLLRSPARLAPWIVAGVVGLLGFLFAAAERAHSPARAAVAVAACSAALQLVITQVVLPEFNVFCSARPWGEQLGRAARGGAAVMTFGFSNREAVSPFLFYAGR